MPLSLHPDTDAEVIWKMAATAEVPPIASMMSESLILETRFLSHMLGSPNIRVKARLAQSLLG
jgi:hypothetical protein